METALKCVKRVPYSFAKDFKIKNGEHNTINIIRISSNKFCQIFENDVTIYCEKTDDSFIFAANKVFEIITNSEDSEVTIKFFN